MKNHSHLHAGSVDTWGTPTFEHAHKPIKARGKMFLKEALALTGMEVSLNSLPAGKGPPFLHRHHKNEELYVFLSGQGEFQVDGEKFEVKEGSAVKVGPKGKRAWRNTGTQPLVYMVIQAPEGTMPTATIDDGESVNEPLRWE